MIASEEVEAVQLQVQATARAIKNLSVRLGQFGYENTGDRLSDAIATELDQTSQLLITLPELALLYDGRSLNL